MQRLIPFLIAALAALSLVPAAAAGGTGATPAAARSALAEAERLFGSQSGVAATDGRGASLVLRDLALALPYLRGGERRRASAILARPSEGSAALGNYFGPEAAGSPICDSHFCVHWGTNAEHAPSPVDADANGVPDFPDAVLSAAADSYAVQNEALGWRDARSDGTRGARGGKGGAGQVDIYLVNLGRQLFGYAAPDPGQRGRSRSGYLVVDNDYARFTGVPLDLMRVTVAHEYNHILQFAYDIAQDRWMFEATATWAEEMVYPEINDYLSFVADFSRAPFKPMAELSRKANRLYGSAMWNHWLTSATGPDTIRTAWEVSVGVKPSGFAVAAYDEAIAAAGGGSFSRQFAAFAAATAEWNSSPAFPDAGLYPEMRRSGSLQRKQKLALDHTAYRLYRVKGGGSRKLSVRVQRGTRSSIALVGRSDSAAGGPEIASAYLPRGGRAKVELADLGRFSRVTAIVINADGRVRGQSRDYSRDRRTFKLKLSR